MIAHYVPLVVEALKGEKFKTLYEIACGDGQNLRAIKEAYPKCEVSGCDIEGSKWGVAACDILDMHPEKKYDIVLVAATLLLFDDHETDRIIQTAKNMAKKLVILVEPVKEGETVNNGTQAARRFQRDYSKYGVESTPFTGWPQGEVGSAVMKIRV